MKQIMAGLGLAFAMMAAAACGGSSSKPAAPAGPTCADVAANTEKQLMEATKDSEMDMTAMAAMAREVITERCTADGWSADAIGCLATATGPQMEECAKKLTPQQNKSLEEAMKAKMQNIEGGWEGAEGG